MLLIYHVVKIFINVVAFLSVKVNSKEICAEISFPSFFGKIINRGFQKPLQRYPFSAWS